MKFCPMVSIIIPVFNGSKYLREAIDSALNQTYHNIEVIVINDGSDDCGKTEQIATSYGERVRYYSKPNGGVATALNFGILNMKGEYFSWLSHDDVYYPEKIETQINYLKKIGNKNVALYSDYEFIDHEGKYLRTNRIKHIPPEKFRYSIIISRPVNGCTTLIPKIFFETVGLFNEKLKTIQDYEMWFRMSEQFDFIHIPEILIKSRRHPEQGSVLIKSHQTEVNQFNVDCLRQISVAEWLSISNEKSASTLYAKLAIKFQRRIPSPASILALRFAMRYLFRDNYITILRNMRLIVFSGMCNSLFILLHKFQHNGERNHK